MKKQILIIGNWKMNPATSKEAIGLARGYTTISIPKHIEIVSAVPFPYLESIKSVYRSSKIKLALQNIYPSDAGAHTGEITFSMVAHLKPAYVLVGHSERRAMGESDDFLAQKVGYALKKNVVPVLCVGERTRDDSGQFLSVIKEQLQKGLALVSKAQISKVVIAYEPVWAIGKDATREATHEECREMMVFIKKVISDITGNSKQLPRIIYGGSVDDKNALDFINLGKADGLLPGRLSLDIKKITKLITILASYATSQKSKN